MVTNRILNIDFEKKQLDEAGIFSGYASNFGNIDSHNDIVMPGAFGEIKDPESIALLWQHDKDKPIGKILEIVEDDAGLFITAQLFLDSINGMVAYNMLKKGAVNGLSIGYRVRQSTKNYTKIRYIKKVQLIEISLVNYPSNSESRVLEVKDAKYLYDLAYSLDRAIQSLKG